MRVLSAVLDLSILRDADYAETLEMQRAAVEALAHDPDAKQRMYLVEHAPVMTLGRSGDGSALRVSPDELARRGIAYYETNRGGDLTYHGPGQWTLYPILRLDRFCKDLHRYMRMLEEVAIRWLALHDLQGVRVPGKTGVWVYAEGAGAPPVKLAAIGVSVRRWISFHGMSVNIDPDLSVFRDLMHPCNIPAAEGGVGSLRALTGQPCDMNKEAEKLAHCFREVFSDAL